MYLRCMPAPSQATSRTPSLSQTDTLVAAASALAQFNFNNSNHSPLDWSPSQRAPHESAASPQNTSPVHFNGWAPPVANPFDSKYRLPPVPTNPSLSMTPIHTSHTRSCASCTTPHHAAVTRAWDSLHHTFPSLPLSNMSRLPAPPASHVPPTPPMHLPPPTHLPPLMHLPHTASPLLGRYSGSSRIYSGRQKCYSPGGKAPAQGESAYRSKVLMTNLSIILLADPPSHLLSTLPHPLPSSLILSSPLHPPSPILTHPPLPPTPPTVQGGGLGGAVGSPRVQMLPIPTRGAGTPF